MKIGTKIKEYRCKNGLTQKDLADRLHVTYQAVSRWENDAAEPSFDCLLDMTKILNCTLDDLFGIEKESEIPVEEAPLRSPVVPEEKIVEKIIVKEAPRLLAMCDECKKALYNEDDIHHVKVRQGKFTEHKTLCTECNARYEIAESSKEKEQKKRRKADLMTRRKRAFIWGTFFALISLIVGIICFARDSKNAGGFFLVATVLVFTFVGCLFLDNNFIPDMWLAIADWGFVNMPGVIMEFSLDGLLIGFALKIVLWIIEIAIAIIAMLCATALGMLLSPFVYPVALKKNINENKI